MFLYWPIVLIDVALLVTIPVYLTTTLISDAVLALAAKAVGGLAAVVFLLTAFDGDTRRAVDAYNQKARENRKSRKWFQYLFLRIGDRRLYTCALILWLELMTTLFTSRKNAQLLLFVGFFLTVSLVLRTVKTKGSWLDDKRP